MTESPKAQALASRSTLQDPVVVAAIGPYEDAPVLSYEDGLPPLRLGSRGAWPPNETEPVLWADIKALYVTTLQDGGAKLGLLQAEVNRANGDAGSPRRVADIAYGDLDDTFEARARLVSGRLLEWALDAGIDRAKWPTVDLTLRPEFTTPEMRDRALAEMAEFESLCAHGDDDVLGRFVEIEPDRRTLLRGTVVLSIMIGLGLACWPVAAGSTSERLALLGPIGLLVAGLCVALVGNNVSMWLTWRRLRIGEEGLELVPGSEPIMWRDIATVDVRPHNWGGLRLTIGTASHSRSKVPSVGGERTYRLAFPVVPGGGRPTSRTLQSFMDSMLAASRGSE